MMGRRKIWEEIRQCPVCDGFFMPQFSNQKYCCSKHADIIKRAKASTLGRRLLVEDWDAAMKRYSR